MLDEFRAKWPEQCITLLDQSWGVIDTSGSLPPLVLLPGTTGTAEIFWNQITALADELRVISVTYPPVPDAVALADGVASLLDHLAIDRVNLLGSSLGGFIAQRFAIRHAARLDTLFVCNSLSDPRPYQAALPPASIVEATPAEAIGQRMLESAANWPEPEAVFALVKEVIADQVSRRISGQALKARVLALLCADELPGLPIDDNQIVIVDCEDDPLLVESIRMDVRRRYPRAESHTFAIGGHFPYITRAKAYTEIIRRRLVLPKDSPCFAARRV